MTLNKKNNLEYHVTETQIFDFLEQFNQSLVINNALTSFDFLIIHF